MTPELLRAATSPLYWGIVVATLLLVGGAVTLHFEGLDRLNRTMPQWRMAPRMRILRLIFVIIALHIAEIWVFGIGLHLITLVPGSGDIGAGTSRILDAVYLSTTTFTTVGYGDLVPRGPLRLVLGSEALTGFVLLTWSASFTYLEMQRFWQADNVSVPARAG